MLGKCKTEKTITLISTVGRSPDHLVAELDDGMVLMCIKNGKYFGLDAVGADIWNKLGGRVVVADLCAALKKEYGADPDTIFRDVCALLEQLLEQGLIEVFP